MTVQDLINALLLLPKDTEIVVEGYENGFDAVHELQQIQVVQVKNPEDFNGQYQLESDLNNHGWYLTTEQKQDITETIQHGKRINAVLIRGKRGQLR
ncbi:hypothetical protein SBP02_11920 [Pseudomonas benzenivorans]|uniref:Uncharacterized protein n=1 Tax=Pseudomonas benzenivorans TaxID=556533 RepID=A0ABZ0PQQ6_9PSED|nr:hypothetical protein [Pseudomonas benzenivorans]WPC03492.1 hypothetical protein SBP02_11920 [Pseudomonas benzenivorans]